MTFPSFTLRFAPGIAGSRSSPAAPRFDANRWNNGGAVGAPSTATASALCEIIERTHFFDLKGGISRERLTDALPIKTAASFIKAFRQTSHPALRDQVNRHLFEMLPAINLFTGEETVLPLVTVSLNRVADDHFLPHRDSSGCACHFDPDRALTAALLEFYERQCLVAATLTGKCRHSINDTDLSKLDAQTASLARPFLLHGKIHIAEIGFHDGAYVVIAAYQGLPTAAVQFSVGCAASFSAHTALKKALAEMQQGYMFFEWRKRMRLRSRRNRNLAERIDKDNAADTWRSFPFFSQVPTLSCENFLVLPTGSRDGLLDNLKAISPNILAYHGATEIDRRIMCFFKVVSPDFLLTRRIDQHYNFDNPFFADLGMTGTERFRHIPFY